MVATRCAPFIFNRVAGEQYESVVYESADTQSSLSQAKADLIRYWGMQESQFFKADRECHCGLDFKLFPVANGPSSVVTAKKAGCIHDPEQICGARFRAITSLNGKRNSPRASSVDDSQRR